MRNQIGLVSLKNNDLQIKNYFFFKAMLSWFYDYIQGILLFWFFWFFPFSLFEFSYIIHFRVFIEKEQESNTNCWFDMAIAWPMHDHIISQLRSVSWIFAKQSLPPMNFPLSTPTQQLNTLSWNFTSSFNL